MKIINFEKKQNSSDKWKDPNNILAGAIDKLDSALVLGVDKEGAIFFSSTIEEKSELIYLMEQIKFDLLAGYFDNDE